MRAVFYTGRLTINDQGIGDYTKNTECELRSESCSVLRWTKERSLWIWLGRGYGWEYLCKDQLINGHIWWTEYGATKQEVQFSTLVSDTQFGARKHLSLIHLCLLPNLLKNIDNYCSVSGLSYLNFFDLRSSAPVGTCLCETSVQCLLWHVKNKESEQKQKYGAGNCKMLHNGKRTWK